MIKETVFFFRHGPATSRRQAEMGLAEFQKWLANEVDKDGYKALREGLVQDLRGEILEVGAGTGADAIEATVGRRDRLRRCPVKLSLRYSEPSTRPMSAIWSWVASL
jgi:hypothetical protein